MNHLIYNQLLLWVIPTFCMVKVVKTLEREPQTCEALFKNTKVHIICLVGSRNLTG